MLKRSAEKNPSTLNPDTIDDASKITIALTIKVNNPRVRIVIGKVSMSKIGLRTAFKIPSTTARISAVINPSTWTPGRR